MAIVNEGLNHMLDVQFHAETPISPWYVLLKGIGTPSAGDTLASHASWAEITAYTGDRKEFVEGAASSQSISNNGSAAVFTINGDAEIYGAGLCGAATANTAKLFNVVDFTSHRVLAYGDILNITMTISAADDGI